MSNVFHSNVLHSSFMIFPIGDYHYIIYLFLLNKQISEKKLQSIYFTGIFPINYEMLSNEQILLS